MGGRSYHDLTQYPVFPWIINNYNIESLNLKLINNNNFSEFLRDLSKPIGALGDEGRKETFIQNYKESCLIYDTYLNKKDNNEFNEGKYYYNSHYSNPFYVTNFLSRLFPYTYCAIELQGSGFDNPNRQFLSIPKAFENCMNHSTDLRELTPEFFYLPEFLNNNNKINFGKISDVEDLNFKINENIDNININKYIQDVATPIWSKDPCYFIYMNRILLESQFVSNKLNEWIDLIFGNKQKGKEAENSMNLFWNYTYEDEINIEEIKSKDIEEYLSYIAKIEFGQTPTQLFKNPILQRLKKDLTKNNKIFLENKKSMKVFKSTSEANNHFRNRKETVKKMIIKIKSLENNKLICVYNNGIIQIMT